MSNADLLIKINNLSAEKKNELNDYLDFLLQKKTKTKKHPKAGFLKNTFILKEDFNDIPDDFKDYI
jgi:hypothetical protein